MSPERADSPRVPLVAHGDVTGRRPRPRDPVEGEVVASTVRIDTRIARGASSIVYRGRSIALDAPVAVKVLDDRHAEDQGVRSRLLREARTLRTLRHPGIVHILDVVELGDGRPALVLEWLEGEDLETRLKREGRLDEDEARRIARELASALAHAHARGVVHRDLKPANVFLVGPERTVVLLDFGVARAPDASSDTATGGVVGTPAYMAPEQATSSARVDGRADVYALGALTFRMVSGEPPYPRDEPMRTLQRIGTERPRELGDLVSVSPELLRLVSACLARDPLLRPRDAASVARALERPVLPNPPPPWPTAMSTVGAFVFVTTSLAMALLAAATAVSPPLMVSTLGVSAAALGAFLAHDLRRAATLRSGFDRTSALLRRASRSAVLGFATYACLRALAVELDVGFLSQSGAFVCAAIAALAEFGADRWLPPTEPRSVER